MTPRSSKSSRTPPPRAGGPGCAIFGCSVRTSCPTSSRSCCTRRRLPAAPPGAACSTRRWRACASRVNGEELTVSDALNKLSDRDRAVREAAGRAVGAAFGENIRLFALMTNTLAKDKEIVDTWRRYPRPAAIATASNMVEDEVVYALVDGGARGLPAPVAPLLRDEGASGSASTSCSIGTATRRCRPTTTRDRLAEARDRVLTAYGAFSPELAEIGGGSSIVHGSTPSLRPGKSGGAFAHPTVPSAHPYLLVNYHGTHARRDDAGARTRARRAPGAGGGSGLSHVGHAAHARRNGQRVRRDADLPRHARR